MNANKKYTFREQFQNDHPELYEQQEREWLESAARVFSLILAGWILIGSTVIASNKSVQETISNTYQKVSGIISKTTKNVGADIHASLRKFR